MSLIVRTVFEQQVRADGVNLCLPDRLDLTAFEYPFLPLFGCHRVYYFSSSASCTSSDGTFMCADRMATALECMLRMYPVFAGRLVCTASGDASETYMSDFDHGVRFVSQAVKTLCLNDIMPDPHARATTYDAWPNGLRLIASTPEMAPTGHETRLPLMTVYHTRFACGGVALGVHTSHYACDGRTAINAMHAWSAFYRDGPNANVSIQPVFPLVAWPLDYDKTCVGASHNNQQEIVTVSPKGLSARATAPFSATALHNVTETQTHARSINGLLRFTSADVQLLRSQCGHAEKHLSTAVILATHVARCLTQARRLDPTTHVQFDVVVDMRKQIFGGDPKFATTDYVGNFNLPSCSTFVAHELVCPGALGHVARQLQVSIMADAKSKTYWREVVSWLTQCRERHFPVRNTSVLSLGSFGPNIFVSVLASLQTYSLSFEDGAYSTWQAGGDPEWSVDGFIMISETGRRDGSFEVNVGVLPQTWTRLLQIECLFPNAPSPHHPRSKL